MSNIFFIRGTIAISVEADKPTIYITPCAGFLTPDKQWAIAFPVCTLDKDKGKGDAKLFKLSDDKKEIKFECDPSIPDIYLAGLIGVSTHQKPVEVRLEIAEPAKQAKSAKDFKITGFVIPAPT